MSDERNNSRGELNRNSTSGFAKPPKGSNRRDFLAQVGSAAAAIAASALTATPVSSQPHDSGATDVPVPEGVTHKRVIEAFHLRVEEAVQDAMVPAATNVHNGDQTRYADKGGTYSKGLLHDSFGSVDPSSFETFTTALTTGKFSDFEKIIMGGTRTLNGPQGGLAFDLEALDNVQFGQPIVPPAPASASEQNATELLEHYWASLLRDVAFTDYGSNALAAAAAAELGAQSTYKGPRNHGGHVTTNLLFRGSFPGETLGPYISQFFLLPTMFGAQPISQQMATYLPNVDYGADFTTWLEIQNGVDTGLRNQVDSQVRHVRNGRDLAAYCHVDVLFQAYFTAYLVLSGSGAPLNPGNPYIGSRTENGFGTFGGPDFAAYQRLEKDYKHESVNHSKGEYSRNGVTTNGTESVFAVLRRGLHGVYHHASKKHLGRYVDEFSFRLNEGNVRRHTWDRLDSFVSAVAGKRITYKRLTA